MHRHPVTIGQTPPAYPLAERGAGAGACPYFLRCAWRIHALREKSIAFYAMCAILRT